MGAFSRDFVGGVRRGGAGSNKNIESVPITGTCNCMCRC